jgi:hypothetical protein
MRILIMGGGKAVPLVLLTPKKNDEFVWDVLDGT